MNVTTKYDAIDIQLGIKEGYDTKCEDIGNASSENNFVMWEVRRRISAFG